MFEWGRLIEYFPKIIEKFPVSLQIVIFSFILGMTLGCVLAMIRLKRVIVLNQIVTVFISYIRCTPIICQMFVIYFGGPAILSACGVDTTSISNMVYVIVAFGLNMAGFMGETIRAAILAVPMGQTEAGRAAGLTETQTMMHIVAPQALRVALPMIGTIFISLFQATALAYMVGVIDMIGKAVSIGARSGHVLEGYIGCAIVFGIISIVLEQVFNFINKRLDFGRSGHSAPKKVRVRKVMEKEAEGVGIL